MHSVDDKVDAKADERWGLNGYFNYARYTRRPPLLLDNIGCSFRQNNKLNSSARPYYSITQEGFNDCGYQRCYRLLLTLIRDIEVPIAVRIYQGFRLTSGWFWGLC